MKGMRCSRAARNAIYMERSVSRSKVRARLFMTPSLRLVPAWWTICIWNWYGLWRMTIPNYLAKIIPVLWLSFQIPAWSATNLAEMVSACRESPTAAKRAAIEAYAVSHAATSDGALAHFALGVIAWEQKDYRAAIDALRKAQSNVPQIADYAAYYLAAARVESKDWDGVEQDLLRVRGLELRSPFTGKSW